MKNRKKVTRKKHIQSCDLAGSMYGKRTTLSSGRTRPLQKKVTRKDLVKVYNKFYKDQVAALYKAIRNN